MPKITFPTGPNIFDPEKPSAVYSRNSVNRSGRDEYKETKTIIDEEVDKILNHINSKLPPEVLNRLHVAGNIKDLLHNYYNQSFQNVFNRYITTAEDEMAKKFRTLVDKEEYNSLNKYSPSDLPKLIEQIAGRDRFSLDKLEHSVANTYKHAVGHMEEGVFELESETNSTLRQKKDIGAFIRGENTYAVVKCSIRDNKKKPKTVSDIVLSMNIIDEEVISKIFHYQEMGEHIIKEVISDKILLKINDEIEKLNSALIDEGRSTIKSNEKIIEAINSVGVQFADETSKNDSDEASGKYEYISKSVFNILSAIDQSDDDFDSLSLKGITKFYFDKENLRNRGYNSAVNNISIILDSAKLGYQYIENFKNSRKLLIGEYNPNSDKLLPDESYAIEMRYVNQEQLEELKIAYDQQIRDFEFEIDQLNDVINSVYNIEYINNQGHVDYKIVENEYLKTETKSKGLFYSSDEEEDEEDITTIPMENIGFISSATSEASEENPSFRIEVLRIKARLKDMQNILERTFKEFYTEERIIIQQRIEFLKDRIYEFEDVFNPFHCQAGIILKIKISSIKRKNVTVKKMSNLLNQFLGGISSGFSDKAFADFSSNKTIHE